MVRNQAERNRQSIRLQHYDYRSPGYYFVTICTRARYPWFDIPDARQAAEAFWQEIPRHIPDAALDEWVLMPNHLHGIVIITEEATCPASWGIAAQHPHTGMPSRRGVAVQRPYIGPGDADPRPVDHRSSPTPGSLGAIVRSYKSAVSRKLHADGLDGFGWHRNYYEHIIRNERELHAIREYIRNNPLRWDDDPENPHAARREDGAPWQ